MGKDYSIITLRSDDPRQIRQYPENNQEKFRTALPHSLKFSWDHEVALISFTYRHEWNQIGPRGAGRFFISVTLPEPLFDDYDETLPENILQLQHMMEAGIEAPTWNWKDIPYSDGPVADWWSTQFIECELPTKAYSDSLVLCNDIVTEVGKKMSRALSVAVGDLFVTPAIKWMPGERRITLAPNIKLFLPDSICRLIKFSKTSGGRGVLEEDMFPFAGPSTYIVYGTTMRQSPLILMPRQYETTTMTVPVRDQKKYLNTGDVEIDIQCSLARPTHIINGSMSNTLYHFRREAKFGTLQTVEPKHLYFLPLRDLNPSSIDIHIIGRSNGSLAVLEKPVTLTLLLQPRQHTLGQI